VSDEKYREVRSEFVKGNITRAEYFRYLAELSAGKKDLVRALMESMGKDIDLNVYFDQGYKNDEVVDAYVAEMLKVVGL